MFISTKLWRHRLEDDIFIATKFWRHTLADDIIYYHKKVLT